jgi:hypothetical protein
VTGCSDVMYTGVGESKGGQEFVVLDPEFLDELSASCRRR